VKRLKWLKWLIAVLLVLCVLLIAACLYRAPLLRGLANQWIINEPLSHADAIVILGGGPDTRPFEAARLYQQGLAPKILLMNPRGSQIQNIGLLPTEAELGRSILLKKGVPTNAIVIAPEIVTNSYDESISVRNWAEANGAQRVIIPTDIFHTRRVHWLYHKELKSTGIQAEIEAVPVNQYTVNDWWQHEDGVVAFQNEVLKYLYYRAKH
jgi:uncharacterized SAM-binding protein YcdF (DUF218 family)